ncbi:MAG: enoyl-CoA hydratase [Gammaproteobacteria bacterium]|nr:MAG: enoyl-CoA hydratase [Gammaproteobacteria bacterium]
MILEPILLNREGSVAQITLNHPPTNSMNLASFSALNEKLTEVENDPSIRVIILTGQGQKGFCAGFDLTAGSNAPQINQKAQEICNQLENSSKPVIAAINGYALGGGCEIAISCHFRFMASQPKAVIGLPELDLGVMPVWGGTQRLPQLVGKSKALEMMLLSQRINARQALEIGLINRVCEPDELLTQAYQFANALAKRPPLAVSAVLKTVRVGIEQGLHAGLQAELDEVVQLGASQDALEGIQAFFEKRAPEFTGK